MIDLGASFHITAQYDYFTSYINGDYGHVRMGNEEASRVMGIGDISWKPVLVVSYSLNM